MIRLKHIDSNFIEKFLRGNNWKVIIKQMILSLEMISYLICLFYISVSAGRDLHILVILSFVSAFLIQVLIIENIKVGYLIHKAIKNSGIVGGYLRIYYKNEQKESI